LLKVSEEDSAEVKLRVLESLDPTRTVAIGNGSNDHLILKEAALGIAVLGEEGMSVSSMKNADIVVKNISNALDLFLKPKRLIATLRE
jgi:soluble P-type ATPase